MATGPVAEVAFELDGREVVRLFERPYRQPLDFGDEYAPHELVARAFDAKGKEIALARQWINLPRPPAEVEILLESDKSGKAIAARLAWASRMGPHPTTIALSIDGRPLSVDASGRASLPTYDASLPHVVSSEVEFPGGIRGHADRVLGGGVADEAGSNLTAIAVRGPTETPPSVESLQGRIRKNGEVLRVMAVERGPAQVYMVRDPGEIKEAFRRFGPYNRGLAATETRLEIEDRIQLVWPLATEVPDQNASNVIFDEAGTIHGVDANFLFALTHGGTAKNGTHRVGSPMPSPWRGSRRPPRDRVAPSCWRWEKTIGITAVDPAPRSGTTSSASAFRSTSGRWRRRRTAALPAAAWGEFDDVSSVIKLHRAASRVQNELRRQSIVWIEGRHLPQDIVLADAGDGLTIAR